MTANRNKVSLILPFDIGRSYALQPRSPCGFPTTQHLPDGWSIGPERPEQPLGTPLRWMLNDASKLPEVKAALETLRWCGCASIETFFYPVGVGVTIARGVLSGRPLAEHWDAFWRWETNPNSYARLADLAKIGSEMYLRLAQGHKEITALRRPVLEGMHEAPWVHPVFMTSDDLSPDMPTVISVAGATVGVSWRGTELKKVSHGSEEVEYALLAAATTWDALALLDKTLANFAHELIQGGPHISEEQAHLVRLFMKQVIDGARATCWTMSRDILVVLESAHEQWRTAELCRSVVDKTELVGMICDRRQSIAREQAQATIGAAALFIACLSLASATKDVLDVFDLTRPWKTSIIALTVALSVVLAIHLFRRNRHPKAFRLQG